VLQKMIMLSERDADSGDHYFRAIFDALPLPAFVVGADGCVIESNAAAARLISPENGLALHRKSGEPLNCLRAGKPGCGSVEHCQDCMIRKSVSEVLSGQTTTRQIHKAEWHTSEGTRAMELLVTASAVPGNGPARALLILEDVSELFTLRGLLPICAKCKKIRDENGRWNHIEDYLRERTHADFTHGICPECAKALYPQYYAARSEARRK
jgi:hypothetical protein